MDGALVVLILVVDARDIGLGRLLVLEPDVLERGLADVGAISARLALTCETDI